VKIKEFSMVSSEKDLIQINKKEIVVKGKSISVDSISIENKAVIKTGNSIKIALLKNEWYEDVDNPQLFINTILDSQLNADIFTFWQRLPESKPKYTYYMEEEELAAIPISTYEHWWRNQINAKTRNMARKAEKKGVTIKIAEFDDDLIRGIMGIFNESPLRRGKRFWHYGKDFNTVKKEMSDRLDQSDFVGAYDNNELIAFIKLIYTGRYAMLTLILDMNKHRDKSPINALIAKAVEICSSKEIPYLTYTTWRKGSHGDFQNRNGFEKISLPRYYVPLNIKGKIILGLNLHHGLLNILPNYIQNVLLDLRNWWYTKKLSTN
jgi:hypothetical protein